MIDPCVGTQITAPLYKDLFIIQNGSTQYITLGLFTPSLAACIPINYAYTISPVTGLIDETWFELKVEDTPVLAVLQKLFLTADSAVFVTMTATSLYAT